MAIAPNTTVLELLRKLAVLNDDVFHDEIFEERGAAIREDLMVTVNEAIMRHESAAESVLKPSDVVALLPIFPGGG